jgi:hypothetical protein
MHAKRPEGPALSGQRPPLPARAMPAQVKLASPVYPVDPVRRTDRGPAPITRLIHLPPPAIRSRVQGPPQLHRTDCSSRQSAFPPGRSCRHGTTARPRAGPRRRPPSARPGDVALRRLGQLQDRAYHADTIRVSPSTDTERPLPCQIQARPRRAARDQRQRGTPPSAPCQLDGPPTSPTRTSLISTVSGSVL